MSHVGNLPDTENLARAPAGRRCASCRATLSAYNRGTLCWPCWESGIDTRLQSPGGSAQGVLKERSAQAQAKARWRENARDRKRRLDEGDPAEVERIRAEIRRIEEAP